MPRYAVHPDDLEAAAALTTGDRSAFAAVHRLVAAACRDAVEALGPGKRPAPRGGRELRPGRVGGRRRPGRGRRGPVRRAGRGGGGVCACRLGGCDGIRSWRGRVVRPDDTVAALPMPIGEPSGLWTGGGRAPGGRRDRHRVAPRGLGRSRRSAPRLDRRCGRRGRRGADRRGAARAHDGRPPGAGGGGPWRLRRRARRRPADHGDAAAVVGRRRADGPRLPRGPSPPSPRSPARIP